MTDDAPAREETTPHRLVLDSEERRVLGVLIEKGLTTPQSYPMSLNSIVTGCNQRSNREPITHYDESQVEGILDRLQQKTLVTQFYPGEGGRVHRWRQDLGKHHELRGVELAVVGELFLRGPQTEGELRQRAARMRPIASLEELHAILAKLQDHQPPFVQRLTPQGVSRGVRFVHACYAEEELAELRAAERAGVPAAPRAAPQDRAAEIEALSARVDELERRLARIEAALGGGP